MWRRGIQLAPVAAILLVGACAVEQKPVPDPATLPSETTAGGLPMDTSEAEQPSALSSGGADDNELEIFQADRALVHPRTVEPPAVYQREYQAESTAKRSRMQEEAAPFVEKRDNLDPANPAFSLLQRPLHAMALFPTDRYGRIDWVRTLADGHIDPRANVTGGEIMRIKKDVVVMKNTREMPYVRFPHLQHTQWLDCSNCHPYPFAEQISGKPITMDEIMRGRGCGLCHDRVAFSIIACERCHNLPHAGSPGAWW